MTPEILRDMNDACLLETFHSIRAVIVADIHAAQDLEPAAHVEEIEQIHRYARVRKDPVVAEIETRLDAQMAEVERGMVTWDEFKEMHGL